MSENAECHQTIIHWTCPDSSVSSICLEFEPDLENERDRGVLPIDLLRLECLERERDLV